MRNQSDTQLLVLFLSKEKKMLQLNPNCVAKSKTCWQSQSWLVDGSQLRLGATATDLFLKTHFLIVSTLILLHCVGAEVGKTI